MTLLTLLAFLVERALTSTYETERYLSAARSATEHGQKVCYDVFEHVSASRKLFQDDDIGLGYLDALDLAQVPTASTSRLPLIDEAGDIAKDEVGRPMTGNVLLFVEEGDPAACIADASSGKVRYVDTYRFVCVYTSQTDRSIVTGKPPALDLVTWRSVRFPSYPQVAAIEDETERAKVVADLHTRYGYDAVWDPDAAVNAAFYSIGALGDLAATPAASPLIDEDRDVSTRGLLVCRGVQLCRTDASTPARRAILTADDPQVWVPDGFEVKIVGASGSRKVWIHLVVESPSSRGRVVVHPSTMIAGVRDL
jgi:hypothetical protein